MAHLIFASTSGARRLYFDLLAFDFGLVQVLHRLFRISHVVEFDEFVVFLVGSLPNLFDLSVLSKGCLELFVACGRVQVENYQSALVLVLLGRIVLGDGVVDVELAPTYNLPLQIAHRVLSVTDVEVRDHHEPAVLALRIHGPNGPMDLEEGSQFVIFHVRVDVAHEQGARGVFAVGMLTKGCDVRDSVHVAKWLRGRGRRGGWRGRGRSRGMRRFRGGRATRCGCRH